MVSFNQFWLTNVIISSEAPDKRIPKLPSTVLNAGQLALMGSINPTLFFEEKMGKLQMWMSFKNYNLFMTLCTWLEISSQSGTP